jgi:hypothetical protein
MRSKAEVERHHDLDRVGNLLPCVIIATAFWG